MGMLDYGWACVVLAVAAVTGTAGSANLTERPDSLSATGAAAFVGIASLT